MILLNVRRAIFSVASFAPIVGMKSLWFVAALLLAVNASAQLHFTALTTVFGQEDSVGFPSVAGNAGGTWIVTWSTAGVLPGSFGTDRDIFISRSQDGGLTWDSPEVILDGMASDDVLDFDPRIAHSDGTWVIIWTSGTISSPPRRLLTTRSVDNGETWSEPQVLTSSFTSHVTRQSLAAANGRFVASWYDLFPQLQGPGPIPFTGDVVASASADGGVTWNGPVTVQNNAWINEKLTESTSVHLDGDGASWVMAWSSNNEGGSALASDSNLYAARSQNGGFSWNNVQVIGGSDSDANLTPMWPSVAALGSNEFIVAYATDTDHPDAGPDPDMLYRKSTDGGATWGAHELLNTNAASDLNVEDLYPSIAYSEGTDRLVAMWLHDGALSESGPNALYPIVTTSVDRGATWTSPQSFAPLTDLGGATQLASNDFGGWVHTFLYFFDDEINVYASPYDLSAPTMDRDGDGISNEDEGTGDVDQDNKPNFADTDADGDGIPDETEGEIDLDGDTIPNFLDTDADGDGVSDGLEVTAGTDPYDASDVPELPLGLAMLLLILTVLGGMAAARMTRRI